eukprot:scaffold1889_cov198-Amphora_coffeaeformis.AAC.9
MVIHPTQHGLQAGNGLAQKCLFRPCDFWGYVKENGSMGRLRGSSPLHFGLLLPTLGHPATDRYSAHWCRDHSTLSDSPWVALKAISYGHLSVSRRRLEGELAVPRMDGFRLCIGDLCSLG